MSIYIIDTETTGIVDPEVIELAWAKVQMAPLRMEPVNTERFRPSGNITWGALATHHIFPHELGDKRPSASAKLPPDTEYIIGHNVDFDWKALGSPDVKRICTLALARRLWPELDSHSLAACLYFINGINDRSRDLLRNAHSADTDVNICAMILGHAQDTLARDGDHLSIEELWEASEDARVPHIMPFGKHKGQPISEVPKAYADWYRRQENPDPYILMAFSWNKK